MRNKAARAVLKAVSAFLVSGMLFFTTLPVYAQDENQAYEAESEESTMFFGEETLSGAEAENTNAPAAEAEEPLLEETEGETASKTEESETKEQEKETQETETQETETQETETQEKEAEGIAEEEDEKTAGEAEASSEDAEAQVLEVPEYDDSDLSDVSAEIQLQMVMRVKYRFDDVDESKWFYDYVQYLYDRGIMTGKTVTCFDPCGKLSRAEVAKIFYRVATSPTGNYKSTFKDVGTGLWYTKAISWISSKGIMTGYNNGNFGPCDSVTREQLATVIYRYASSIGKSTSVSSKEILNNYKDGSQVSSYARNAVAWCVEKGIMGKDVSNLRPKEGLSRAENAVMITRMIQTLGLQYSQNYHTHQNGMAIPHWYQNDAFWASVHYGDGTMAQNACGPTCAAMIITYFTGEMLTPLDIIEDIGNSYWSNYGSGGTKDGIFDEYVEKYGIKATRIGNNISTIVAELKAGHPVVALLNSNSFRTSGGHFVVYRGLSADGTKVLVNDPIGDERLSEDIQDAISELSGTIKRAWTFQ